MHASTKRTNFIGLRGKSCSGVMGTRSNSTYFLVLQGKSSSNAGTIGEQTKVKVGPT